MCEPLQHKGHTSTVRGRSRVVRERRELVESSTLDEVEEKG